MPYSEEQGLSPEGRAILAELYISWLESHHNDLPEKKAQVKEFYQLLAA